MSGSAALLAQATAALGRPAATAWFAPGRIEVFGKHTDYAGGEVLTAAVDLGVVVAGSPRSDGRVVVRSGAERVEVISAAPRPGPGLATYVAAVVGRLARDFPGTVLGADLAVAADLPAAAGLSSSSALLCAMTMALARLHGLQRTPAWIGSIRDGVDLAGWLACVENGSPFAGWGGGAGVGTRGGSEDHIAICQGRVGHLTRWRCAPAARLADVALPEGLVFLVAVSGARAEKAGAALHAYNSCSDRAAAALQAWNRASGRSDPSLGAALAAVGAPALLRALPAGELRVRAEQFACESGELVPAAAAALAAGDLAAFARAAARSHGLAASHLGNQVPETNALVDTALGCGARAASAFGAGFGGAVWALVDSERAAAIAAAWLEAYLVRHPGRRTEASVHRVAPGQPLAELIGGP